MKFQTFSSNYEEKSREEILRDLYNSYKKNEKLEKAKERIQKEKEKLERELKKYKNPNTPSSANQHLKPNTQGAQSKLRAHRGAPKGHTGNTHLWGDPDEERHACENPKECPICGSKNITLVKEAEKEQILAEIPEHVEIQTVKITRKKWRCENNHFFYSRDGKTPTEGHFGLNIMVMIVMLRYVLRGVLRKTAKFFEASFALKLSPATINSILSRVSKAADTEFNDLKTRIRQSKKLWVDETSFSVLGKNRWVWVFRSPTDTLLIIRGSRGSDVLREILTETYRGIIHCDGWRAYDFLKKAIIQRCWAHLLRKSETLETIVGKNFHQHLTELFAEIKLFNAKEPTKKQRERKYNSMNKKLQKIISYYTKYEECQPIITYINNHFDQWFNCVRYPGIEPTNNFGEQAIRETTLIRKIIGAFRSENGTQVYEKLASLIATWTLQQKDIKQELTRIIQKNLC